LDIFTGWALVEGTGDVSGITWEPEQPMARTDSTMMIPSKNSRHLIVIIQ
jgi:hypothetical protein